MFTHQYLPSNFKQVNDFLKFLFFGYMPKDTFDYCLKVLYIDIDKKSAVKDQYISSFGQTPRSFLHVVKRQATSTICELVTSL